MAVEINIGIVIALVWFLCVVCFLGYLLGKEVQKMCDEKAQARKKTVRHCKDLD